MTTPSIVVLDAFTLTPNEPRQVIDADEPVWDGLAELGEVTVYPRTAGPQIVERSADASIVLTNKTPVAADTLASLPKLRYVGLLSTGTNVVDLDAAKSRGVTVTNAPAYSTDSVAQHVFALLLELASHVADHDRSVHDGEWVRSSDFCFTVAPITELAGKNLGIVGLGDIGSRVAAIGAALGMNVLVHSRTRKPLPGVEVKWVGLDELFAESDAVSLHCPLTSDTRGMVSAARLATMKPTAWLINTGRGPLIDEAALAGALHEGRLAGAGLDVLGAEPPAADNPLLAAPRCILTPHIAWASREARARLMQIVAGNVRAFLDGRPENVVSG